MTRDKIQIQVLHDKSAILTFLKKSEELQFYCIGDLDDFYWPKTTWYGLIENDVIRSIALLYTAPDVPTLLMFYDNNPEYSFELLKSIRPILPDYHGQQIAFRLTSRLCNDLFKDVNLIGLNVKSDNKSAIRCYEKIGFEISGNYEECFIKNY